MNEKILIVDDSHTIVKTIEIILGRMKFNLRGAFTGKEGIEVVRVFKPDLILLDIDMPGINGFETLVEIKKLMNKDYSATVIMLSGHNSPNDVIQSIKNGAQDYIVKPFTEENLLQKLKKHLNF